MTHNLTQQTYPNLKMCVYLISHVLTLGKYGLHHHHSIITSNCMKRVQFQVKNIGAGSSLL